MNFHRHLPLAVLCTALLSLPACKESSDTPVDPPSNGGDSSTTLQVDANGVPVITGTNMPKSGENWHYVTATIPEGLDVTAAGPNRTWDFSKLVATDEYTVTHVAPGQTSATTFFPAATIAEGDDHSSIYVYMRQLPDVMQGLGLWQRSNGFLMAYSRPDTTWLYPFRYGMKVASVGYGIFRGPFDEIHRASYDTTYADGWGTLILPNGTYQKVLRVALPSRIIDSTFINGSFSHAGIDQAQSYLWYAPGKRFPVATAYVVTGNLSLSEVMWDSTRVAGATRGTPFGKAARHGSIVAHLAGRGFIPMPLTGRAVKMPELSARP
jgi:hypothetical protein